MPNQNIKDDDIVIKDETVPASDDPDEQGGEIPPAEKESSDSASPKSSADSDLEELKAELKNKARNERQLGSIAKKTAKSLLNKANSGDEDAIELINEDYELQNYLKKKFPEDYGESFSEVVDPDSTAKKAVEIMKRENSQEKIKQILTDKGIKGKENIDRLMGFANSLLEKGATIDGATSGALATIKTHSTQPNIPRGSASGASGGLTLSKSKILGLGLNVEVTTKLAKQGKLSQQTLNIIKKS